MKNLLFLLQWNSCSVYWWSEQWQYVGYILRSSQHYGSGNGALAALKVRKPLHEFFIIFHARQPRRLHCPVLLLWWLWSLPSLCRTWTAEGAGVWGWTDWRSYLAHRELDRRLQSRVQPGDTVTRGKLWGETTLRLYAWFQFSCLSWQLCMEPSTVQQDTALCVHGALQKESYLFSHKQTGLTASLVSWSEFLATNPVVPGSTKAIPDFLSSSGSGTGCPHLLEDKWGAT
jgi:hypothetical protein